MKTDDYQNLLNQGIAAAEQGQFPTAQAYLDQAAAIRRSPEVMSYLAYCLARGQRQLQDALKINREAIDREPGNSLHYLIMGRILLLAGRRDKAIMAFRQGLKASPNPKIINELKKLGLRKPPVFHSLDRGHILNRVSGKLLSRLGLR